jgi:hypothetical protein
MSAFGCHVQTTAAIKALKAEIAQLRGGLQRSIALPTATEAARNVALEEEVDRLRAELANARRTAEYWKAEHLAGNAELDALKSDPVPSIPEGYQLVPVEPTFEMQRAGMYTESNPDDPVSLTFREVTAIYKAMLAAAKDEKC